MTLFHNYFVTHYNQHIFLHAFAFQGDSLVVECTADSTLRDWVTTVSDFNWKCHYFKTNIKGSYIKTQ